MFGLEGVQPTFEGGLWPPQGEIGTRSYFAWRQSYSSELVLRWGSSRPSFEGSTWGSRLRSLKL